jgi:hydrogenase-4 component F
MVRAEFQAGLGWAAAVALVAMLVIFIAMVNHARCMLLGRANAPTATTSPSSVTLVPLVVGLACCAAIGVFSWPLTGLLQAAAHAVAL